MRANGFGLQSVGFLCIAALAACSSSGSDGPASASKSQALVNGCRLPTVGAACDPDGDGPASSCEGICIIDETKDNSPQCVPTSTTANDGMPCGELVDEHVDCTRSCRAGVCTTTIADDFKPCMPSGSPYYSAVCEGECRAGACEKLSKPHHCPAIGDSGTDGPIPIESELDSGGGPSGGGGGSSGGGDGGGGGTGDDAGATGGGGSTGGGGGTGDDAGTAGGGGSTGGGGGTGADSGTSGGGGSTGGTGDSGTAGGGSGGPTDDASGASTTLDGGTRGGGSTTGAGDDAGAGIVADGAGGAVTDPNTGAPDGSAGDTGGCGCRTPASTTGSSYAAGWLAAAAMIMTRLRRRR